MNDGNLQIILTGSPTQTEAAIITVIPRVRRTDGIDIETSVKVLEYEFKVETFFYGYNLATFLTEAERLSLDETKIAHLFNYNETLVFEFIKENGSIFLSINYTSILPQRAEDGFLTKLQEASKLDSTTTVGSRFSFSFMPLHNSITEVITWMEKILANNALSITSPYP